MAHNILIVDDSATTRAMIKRTIRLAEIAVDNLYDAADGVAGLEVLSSSRVDLVLADLNMPNMGGVEMTRRMRQTEGMQSVPVVIVSAEPNAQRLEELKQHGIQGYIRKPFTPESLRDLIAEILGVCHA